MTARIRPHRDRFVVEEMNHGARRWRIVASLPDLKDAAIQTLHRDLEFSEWSGEDLSRNIKRAEDRILARIDEISGVSKPKGTAKPKGGSGGATKKP